MLSKTAAFAWTDESMLFFVKSYVAINLKLAIDEVSSIIIKYLKSLLINYHINNKNSSSVRYMSDNSIVFKFKVNEKFVYGWRRKTHPHSTIIFKSEMIVNTIRIL